MWMKLSRETKALILGLKAPPVPPRRMPHAPNNRKSMLHNISAFEFLNNIDDSFPPPQPTDMITNPDTTLLANVTSLHDNHISPADIRKVLSTTKTSNPPQKLKPTPDSATVTIDGVKYRQCNTLLTYRVSEHKHKPNSSLIDRGANGGFVGNDVRRIATCSDKTVNIMGIDNHQLSSIPLVTAGGVSQSQMGPVILIFNQYAHYGKGKSIHSPVQFETFHNKVDDRTNKLGGKQTLLTHDGYAFPLDFTDGLPYLRLRPFTDSEWDKLTRIHDI
jgi:hypothetical protein